MTSALEQSISQTLSYFSLLNFPLTQEELFRYLWFPPRLTFAEFVTQLDVLAGQGRVQTSNGFYFLAGEEKNIEIRRRSTVPSDLKLKKARRAMRLIRAVPFLRAVAITSSVATESAGPESDIDFFIIAEAGRIWIVRFFTNLILRLLGLRIYGDKKKDRICLSFYVDTAHLDLSAWRIAKDDVRFAYLIAGMVPLYDDGWCSKNYYRPTPGSNRRCRI